MNKKKLLEYCKEKDIIVPKGATVQYLECAIVRSALKDKKIEADSCFGYWEYENSACIVCDYKEQCFKASIGMDKGEYFKKFGRLKNPRIKV